MGSRKQLNAELVRQARDAETAHLDAVLKVHGAAYLRLASLAEHLNAKVIPQGDTVKVKAAPGSEPMLWLDVVHSITMEPDAKTYRLTHHGLQVKTVLLETPDLPGIVEAAGRIWAHQGVRDMRETTPAVVSWRYATLIYIWMTGIVTGAAALALYYIYLK